MPAVVRQGDVNSAGGQAIGDLANTVLVNGVPCAVVGTVISPHAPWGPPHPPHEAPTITTGESTVLVEGRIISIIGSGNTCGHVMAQGSPDVVAG